jgi:YD repeat-containing protein
MNLRFERVVKMNIKTAVVLTFLGAGWAWTQETHLNIKVPDTVESDLFGPVKSTQTTHKKRTLSGSLTEQTEKETVCTYDEKGNLHLIVTREITENSTNRVEYTYDAAGCLTGRLAVTSSPDTNTTSTFTYSIHTESRQILRRDSETGDFQVTVYSPAGYEQYWEERTSSNKLKKAIQTHRLPDNKEYESLIYDGEKKLTSTFLTKWNIQGLEREYSYQKHATNGYTFITKYTHPEKDTKGNWTKRISRTSLIEKGEEREDGVEKDYSEEVSVRKIEYFDKKPDSAPGDTKSI